MSQTNLPPNVFRLITQKAHGIEGTDDLDKGGGGPHDPGMEARIAKLENDVSAMKTDVAVIKSNYATKSDIAEAKNSVIMWVVSAILLAQLLPAILKKLGM